MEEAEEEGFGGGGGGIGGRRSWRGPSGRRHDGGVGCGGVLCRWRKYGASTVAGFYEARMIRYAFCAVRWQLLWLGACDSHLCGRRESRESTG